MSTGPVPPTVAELLTFAYERRVDDSPESTAIRMVSEYGLTRALHVADLFARGHLGPIRFHYRDVLQEIFKLEVK